MSGDGLSMLNPSLPSRLCIQMTSRPAEAAETYSASVDEFAMVGCFLEDQLIAPVPIFITKPLVDLQVLKHPP